MSNRTRVVVTGLGATTPLGGDVPSTWAALLAGKSGARLLDEEWTEVSTVKFAARVAVDPSEVMERVEMRRLDRSEQFASFRWFRMGLFEMKISYPVVVIHIP